MRRRRRCNIVDISDKLKYLKDKNGNRVIVVPHMSYSSKLWINHALKMYSEFRPAEAGYIKNLMVMVSHDHIFNEDQFRTVLRAVLCFKLNAPEEAIVLHGILTRTITKLKGVMHDYGLDSDEGNEGET